MDTDNKFFIPSSIVLAGVIIAGAVLYVKAPSAPAGAPLGGVADSKPGFKEAGADAFKIRQDDFILGNPSAKVILVEYGDFQCPFCGRFYKTTESELKNTYIKEGTAALVWRDFAFLGEESFRAAEAARCAGEQGKFWQYHDHLFNNQLGENEGAFADVNLKSFAKTIGLNEAQFNSCLDSGKYRKAVEEQSEDGRTLGVSGTPTTFVNGRAVSGAQPFSAFEKVIKEELKK